MNGLYDEHSFRDMIYTIFYCLAGVTFSLITGLISMSRLLLFCCQDRVEEANIASLLVVPVLLITIGFIGLCYSVHADMFLSFGLWFLFVAMIGSVIYGLTEDLQDTLERIKNYIEMIISAIPIIIYGVLMLGGLILIGLAVYLYIDVYDPLANNEWKAMSLFSYPDWFSRLSDEELRKLNKKRKE